MCLRREAKWGRTPAEASRIWLDSSGNPGLLVGVRPEGLRAILPKWFLPTRLETRTKESNIYASVLVEKPTRIMKVKGAKLPAASTDHDSLMKGLSMSISVRTRKMVNYA